MSDCNKYEEARASQLKRIEENRQRTLCGNDINDGNKIKNNAISLPQQEALEDDVNGVALVPQGNQQDSDADNMGIGGSAEDSKNDMPKTGKRKRETEDDSRDITQTVSSTDTDLIEQSTPTKAEKIYEFDRSDKRQRSECTQPCGQTKSPAAENSPSIAPQVGSETQTATPALSTLPTLPTRTSKTAQNQSIDTKPISFPVTPMRKSPEITKLTPEAIPFTPKREHSYPVDDGILKHFSTLHNALKQIKVENTTSDKLLKEIQARQGQMRKLAAEMNELEREREAADQRAKDQIEIVQNVQQALPRFLFGGLMNL